jgi:hypothetical protein
MNHNQNCNFCVKIKHLFVSLYILWFHIISDNELFERDVTLAATKIKLINYKKKEFSDRVCCMCGTP